MFSPAVKTFLSHFAVCLLVTVILCIGYATTNYNDIWLYQHYAANFLTLSPNAQRLPSEYPVLSILLMLLPTLGGDANYALLFVIQMLLVVLGVYFFLVYTSTKKAAFAYLCFVVIGGFGIVLSRLDIVVGLLLLLSLYEAEQKKFTSAYLLLAVGTAFKLIPILLLIPLFLAEQQTSPKNKKKSRLHLGLFFLVIAVIFAIAGFIDPKNALSPLTYGIDRPVQVESVAASVVHAFSLGGIIQTCTSTEFGSLNIHILTNNVCNSSWDGFIKAGSVGLLLLAIGGVVFAARLFLSKRLELGSFYIVLLLLCLCVNKVLSPQYILWIIPLAAYVHRFARKFFSLLLLLCLLTTSVFPMLYNQSSLLPSFGIDGEQGILVRNAVLVVTTLAYLFNWGKVRDEKTTVSA